MTTFEIVKRLCQDRKISINDLEESLGYSKNTLYRLKTQTPGADKLAAIADYFNVSTDYLLGRSDQKDISINKDIQTIAAHHDGEEWTEEELEEIERFKEFVRMKRNK
ncbi:helix-turn-helix domain-containing protein [Lysinibacillus capsici]|uniref:helix-turn-helix domain-containing protein n=1 Tax=Lysinibacillus capsici TaxID=2115968 RepID=UPI000E20B997|nr:helix-turn-helix transcriptional regulator [Lysinibacillus capsici]RDV27132.1 XRE family transcriptional regulator [Lysinibacillus capsici]